MKIPVLIEPTPERRYVATGCAPFGVSAEGDTPDDALAKVEVLLNERVAAGARIASVELSGGSNPWLAGAGMFAGDPLFEDWQQAIFQRRRAENEATDEP